jgi:hypothetical protein
MNGPSGKDKFTRILDNLFDQISIGWRALLVAKYIYQANERQPISSARYFFLSVYAACIESTILALARLVIEHADSVTIGYLLNCAFNNPSDFAYADKETVQSSVAEHRKQLDNIANLVESVRTHRDLTIAHLDRKHVNQPGAIDSLVPIDLRQVENLFSQLLNIVNVYKGYFDSSEYRIDVLGPRIKEDISYLLGLIKQANLKE